MRPINQYIDYVQINQSINQYQGMYFFHIVNQVAFFPTISHWVMLTIGKTMTYNWPPTSNFAPCGISFTASSPLLYKCRLLEELLENLQPTKVCLRRKKTEMKIKVRQAWRKFNFHRLITIYSKEEKNLVQAFFFDYFVS